MGERKVNDLADELPGKETMMPVISEFTHLVAALKLVSGGLNLVVAPQVCIQIQNARSADITAIIDAVLDRL